MNFEKSQISLVLDAVNENEKEEQRFSIDDKFITNFDPVMKIDIDLNISA